MPLTQLEPVAVTTCSGLTVATTSILASRNSVNTSSIAPKIPTTHHVFARVEHRTDAAAAELPVESITPGRSLFGKRSGVSYAPVATVTCCVRKWTQAFDCAGVWTTLQNPE